MKTAWKRDNIRNKKDFRNWQERRRGGANQGTGCSIDR